MMSEVTPRDQSEPVPPPSEAPRLTFGIFPGMTGTEEGLAGPLRHDPAGTEETLARLQPEGQPFSIRAYVLYDGTGQTPYVTPEDCARYIHGERRLDYVLCYRTLTADLEDWTRFVRHSIQQLGPFLGTVQITEEPNNPDAEMGGNGSFPRVREAIIAGLAAAKDEIVRQRLGARAGFNATPSFNPADDFWPAIAALGGQTFRDALDYVGFDFFPDVFRPLPFNQLRPAVEAVLRQFRTTNLAMGGIPASVPIRICENGWPTGPGRSPERQADVLEAVLRSVHQLRGELHLTHFAYFSLRDGESSSNDMGRQFGLVRDDYTPKPAFDRYRSLMTELGRPH